MTPSGSNDTIEAVFESAIGFEYKAADLFREFSKLFSHIQEISSFWQKLANDEIHHADTLQNIRTSLNSEELLSPCNEEMAMKVDITQRMLNEVSISSIMNLDDAYELAHELEFSEVNSIFLLLTSEFIHSQEQEQFIFSEITKHQQKLVDFTNNFGNKDWRKGISIHAVQ
jgi:rubrerythrin